MTPYDVLGYVVARGVLGTPSARVLVGADETDGVIGSTWSHDDEHALLLPSRTAAVMLACAIGAGDAQILTTVAAQQETRMSKREIRKRLAEYADELARESGDPAAVRDAWIDVGASDAGWRRRGIPLPRAKRVGARAKR